MPFVLSVASRRLWLCGASILLALALPVLAAPTNYPSWWTERGVIATNGVVTNDYAGVNAGQLKWITVKAKAELDQYLAGGAGTNVDALVSGFTASNNYSWVNLGQLKNVGARFYDRLITYSYATNYPWTDVTNDDCNYAAANIGQLKRVFGFDFRALADPDGDGLRSGVETGTGIYVDPTNTGTSPGVLDTDGDSLSDGAEVAARTDPNNPDTTSPTLTVTYPPTQVWRLVP